MIKFKGGIPEWTKPDDLPSLAGAKEIGFDLETKDLGIQAGIGPGGYRNAGEILGAAIAVEGMSWYISLRHPHSDNFSEEAFRRWAGKELTRDNQLKIGANILYDLEWMGAEDFPISGPFLDVQHVEALINELRGRYNLSVLSEHYLPKKWHKASDLLDQKVEEYLGGIPKGAKPIQLINECPAEVVGSYAEIDAESSRRIWEKQRPIIRREGLDRVLQLECDLIPVLLAMRLRGVRVDTKKAAGLVDELNDRVVKLQKKLDKLAGQPVNFHSGPSLAPVFDKLNVPYPLTKKTKKPSIKKEWLEAHPSPIAADVRTARKLDKARSTFIEGGIMGHVYRDRIHAQANQLRQGDSGAVTGRFSYSNPNLQQIPSRDEELAPLIRGLFIPEPGQEWYKKDYSQIEYRMIVHFAVVAGCRGAEDAARAYRENPEQDFHEWVAELIRWPRRTAKDINFGMAYTMGVEKLAASLGISMQEARSILVTYHKEVPFVRDLSTKMMRAAEVRGYIKTILGRRRRFPYWEPPDNYKNNPNYVQPLPLEEAEKVYKDHPRLRRAFAYKAMNSCIQGSAADLMKMAMVNLYKSGIYDGGGIGPALLTVHDELDGSKDKTKKATATLFESARIMEEAIPLEVPVKVDVETGPDWGHVKEEKK